MKNTQSRPPLSGREFKALAAETRRKMQAKHEKGQKLGLGNSRKKK